MFVQNHMTPNPRTIAPDAPVSQVAEMMKEGRFHQVPVADGNGNLLGIVTDRDIRFATGYESGARVPLLVEEVMTPNPVCIDQDEILEEAVKMFCRHHFGAFPVMNGNRLVGIISRSDILQAFHDLLGLEGASRRIEVAIPHGVADIACAVNALNDHDEVASLVAARLRSDGHEPVLYIRVRSGNPVQIERKLRNAGVIVLAPEKTRVPL